MISTFDLTTLNVCHTLRSALERPNQYSTIKLYGAINSTYSEALSHEDSADK